MTYVVWVSYHQPPIIARGYWDQGFLEDLFAGNVRHGVPVIAPMHVYSFEDVPAGEGAIVVVPARHHSSDEDVVRLVGDINGLTWCLLILTGDEGNEFPRDRVSHPNYVMWVMHPNDEVCDEAIGSGYPPHMAQYLPPTKRERDVAWAFMGQVTHKLREDLAALLRSRDDGVLMETSGFTQGLDPREYYDILSRARVAFCPGGPLSPDSFRLYEALEAGCLPLVDERSRGYWSRVHPGMQAAGIDIVHEWRDVSVGSVVAHARRKSFTASAWWQQEKRRLARRLVDDVASLSHHPALFASPTTIIITTSPSVLHPDTTQLDEVLESACERWPQSEVIVAFDGVREEQEHLRPGYEEYIDELTHEWRRTGRVTPIVMNTHVHQANLMRAACELVRTPLVLFLEHDTPLVNDIPVGGLETFLLSDLGDVIRFYHESSVHPTHEHLMLGEPVVLGPSVRLTMTRQWSQRPHLARTSYYQRLMRDVFDPSSRTMIEDVMYGIVSNTVRERGLEGWADHRIWLFTPEGNTCRSTHLDGRRDEPKYEMTFAYPSDEVPKGAPAPTKR